MKKFILTILFATTILFGQAQELGKNFIDQNYIEVSGFAERLITPNRIYLKILINEKDVKGKTLQQIEKSMIEKLEEVGINTPEDLVIKDFTSNFKHHWILKSDILLIKEYQLLVYDAKTAGQVFMELEKLGISNISIEKLYHSEIDKFRQEVKRESIKSAQNEAKVLTAAINQDVGRAIYIIENHIKNVNMTGALEGKAKGIVVRGISSKAIYGSRAAQPDIGFEKIKLEYHITVKFELK